MIIDDYDEHDDHNCGGKEEGWKIINYYKVGLEYDDGDLVYRIGG